MRSDKKSRERDRDREREEYDTLGNSPILAGLVRKTVPVTSASDCYCPPPVPHNVTSTSASNFNIFQVCTLFSCLLMRPGK